MTESGAEVVRARSTDLEDRLIDRVFEGDFEWRQVVRSYPLPALLVAAVVGYVVGRNHGREILELASETASERVARALQPPPPR